MLMRLRWIVLQSYQSVHSFSFLSASFLASSNTFIPMPIFRTLLPVVSFGLLESFGSSGSFLTLLALLILHSFPFVHSPSVVRVL